MAYLILDLNIAYRLIKQSDKLVVMRGHTGGKPMLFSFMNKNNYEPLYIVSINLVFDPWSQARRVFLILC